MKKLLFIAVLAGLQLTTAQTSKVVLKTDFDGAVTEGSIDELIKNIQEGATIRLGWQIDFNQDTITDIEHWVTAEFLTIMNGHVYNQVNTINQQSPMPDNVGLTSVGNSWRAIISTKGIMQHLYDFKELPKIGGMNGEEISEKQQKEIIDNLLKMQEDKVATTWAASF